jgi:hypothetical protein
MTETLRPKPFSRKMYAARDNLVGARWWHDSLHRSAPDPISRRKALLALATVLGPAAGVGLLVWLFSSADEEVDLTMDALELQRRNGWNFGYFPALRFPNPSSLDIDGTTEWRDALSTLAADFAPAQVSLAPFYVPTLLQAPAYPGSATLRAALTPMSPAPDNADVMRGEAIRSLFEGGQTPQDIAVILDLGGPTSVAVAAGMAPSFDPVFVFDNWPHPLGVVPSHLTLGALLYYRPLFMRLRATRTKRSPPVFVLDRNRLARYMDEETQFDNRYVARLPTATNLQSLGIQRLLYITPDKSEMLELDDLNADFVAYRDASIDVKVMPLSDLMRPPAQATSSGSAGQVATSSGYYYGGYPHTHFFFWQTYGWHSPTAAPRSFVRRTPSPLPQVSRGAEYRPAPRPTIFSSRTFGGGAGIGKQKPAGFGRVSVRASKSTGSITAARIGRSGSFGRAGGWGSS